MGYIAALKHAGAKVHAETFSGDYQGTWLAIVTYEGKLGVAMGAFGSCSACDSFQAWQDEIAYGDGSFSECRDPTDEEYAAFAKTYLENVRDPAYVIDMYREQSEWDSEADETIAWLITEFEKLGWREDVSEQKKEVVSSVAIHDFGVVFDETTLRSELVRAFGQESPHVEVYDLILAKLTPSDSTEV